MSQVQDLIKLIENLKEDDRQKLIEHFSPVPDADIWIKGGWERREEVYRTYAKEVADLIAKIEVYSHDLPPSVGALVEWIWHMLAVAANQTDEELQAAAYDAATKYMLHVKNELKLLLLSSYLTTIEGYIKTLSCFKHRPYKGRGGKPVVDEAKQSLRKIKKLIRKAKRIRKHHFITAKYDGVKCFVVNYDIVVTIEEISQAITIAENTIKDCEDNFSEIINHGYNETFLSRLFMLLPGLVASGFTLYGFWLLIQRIFPLL